MVGQFTSPILGVNSYPDAYMIQHNMHIQMPKKYAWLGILALCLIRNYKANCILCVWISGVIKESEAVSRMDDKRSNQWN